MRSQVPTSASLVLPDWAHEDLDLTRSGSSRERMQIAIDLAERSVEHGGGPFGAVVFDLNEQRIASVGVNLVLLGHASVFHAEVVALTLAQQALGSYSLGHGRFELCTSCQPCAQCLGAVCWSGIRRLCCGARAEDAEAIGFDEGPIREDWVEQLEQRNIHVERDVLRDAARAVLRDYARGGGIIYNG